MTAKEKAEELVDKYRNTIVSFLNDNMKDMNAKQSALIAVDEIIKSNPIIPLTFMLESEALYIANIYWEEVKQEIEKL